MGYPAVMLVPCGPSVGLNPPTRSPAAAAHDHLDESSPRLPRRRSRRRLRRGRAGQRLHAAREGRLDAGLAHRDLRDDRRRPARIHGDRQSPANAALFSLVPTARGAGGRGVVEPSPAAHAFNQVHEHASDGRFAFTRLRQARRLLAHRGDKRAHPRHPARPGNRPMLRRPGRTGDFDGRSGPPQDAAAVRRGRGCRAAACADLRRRPCRPCAGIGVCAAAGAADRRRDARRRPGRHRTSKPD